MKTQWTRILAAGILAELLLLAIYIPAQRYAGPAFLPIAILDVVGSMLLAGFWIARKTPSQFLLHGLLVGIVANAVYAILKPIAAGWGHFFAVAGFKTLVCATGACLGGRFSRSVAISKPPL